MSQRAVIECIIPLIAFPLIGIAATKISKAVKNLRQWNEEQLTSVYKDEWEKAQTEETSAFLRHVHFGDGKFSFSKILFQSYLLPKKLSQMDAPLLKTYVSSLLYSQAWLVHLCKKNPNAYSSYLLMPFFMWTTSHMLKKLGGVEQIVHDLLIDGEQHVYLNVPGRDTLDSVCDFYIALLYALDGKNFDKCLLAPPFGHDDNNVLHLACQHKNINIMTAFLKFSSPTLTHRLLKQQNKQGNTPLHVACMSFDDNNDDETGIKLIELMFEQIQEPSREVLYKTLNLEGETILHWASMHHAPSNLLATLIDKLPDFCRHSVLEIQDGDGYTPLHYIVENNDQTVFEEKIKSFQRSLNGESYLRLMKILNKQGYSVLHTFLRNPCFWDAPSIMRKKMLMNLTLKQRREAFEIADKSGNKVHQTASQIADANVSARNQAAEHKQTLLEMVTAEGTETQDREDAELELQESLEGLSMEDLKLTVSSKYMTRYLIPSIFSAREYNCIPHAMVLYTSTDRPGAHAEADSLIDSFKVTGLTPFKSEWTNFVKLIKDVYQYLKKIRSKCSLLVVCLMAHGRLGEVLDGNGDSKEINSLLETLTNGLEAHTPLIVIIQVCQEDQLQPLVGACTTEISTQTAKVPRSGETQSAASSISTQSESNPSLAYSSTASEQVTQTVGPEAGKQSVTNGPENDVRNESKFDAIEEIETSYDAKDPKKENTCRDIRLKRKHTAILHATVAEGKALRGGFTKAIAKQIAASDGKTSIEKMFEKAAADMIDIYGRQIPRYEKTMDRACCIPPACCDLEFMASSFDKE